MIVTIYRTRIDLFPYELGICESLEKRLKVFDYTVKKYIAELYLYNKKTKIMSVPRGLGIFEVKKALENDNIIGFKIENKEDLYIEPGIAEIKLRPDVVPRDEHQEKAINFLVSGNIGQKYCCLYTGIGKTFVAIASVSLLKTPTLIIINTSVLIEQWARVIKQYTFCNDLDVITIQGREIISKIMKNKPNYMFYVASTATMSILADEGELENFVKHAKIGVKIVDEAHRMYVSSNKIDLKCNIKHNFYLTATPQRSSTEDNRMYNKIINTIPRFGEYTKELNNHFHIIDLKINTFPTAYEEEYCRTVKGFSSMLYESFIFNNYKRRTYFYLIAHYICVRMLVKDENCKILILLAKNANIDTMADMLKQYLGINIGKFNSNTKDLVKKKSILDNNNVILSTLGSSMVGLDLKDLRVILPFVPFSSTVILEQLRGRLRPIEGKAVYYINVTDEGFEAIMRQSSSKMSILRKTAKTLKVIDLSMNRLLNSLKNGEIKPLKDSKG
jgi:superfamily II DNA or RNA helicase